MYLHWKSWTGYRPLHNTRVENIHRLNRDYSSTQISTSPKILFPPNYLKSMKPFIKEIHFKRIKNIQENQCIHVVHVNFQDFLTKKNRNTKLTSFALAIWVPSSIEFMILVIVYIDVELMVLCKHFIAFTNWSGTRRSFVVTCDFIFLINLTMCFVRTRSWRR